MDPTQPNINPTPNPAPAPNPEPIAPNPAPVAPEPAPAVEPTPVVDQPAPATGEAPATAAPAPQPEGAKKGGKKKIGLIIGLIVGALAIAGVVILIISLLGGGIGNGPLFESKAFFIKNKDEKYILINENGERASEDVYEEAGDIVNGMALVKKDGKTGVVKDNGQMSIDFDEYENEIVEVGAGLYSVSVSDGDGVIQRLITGSNKTIVESEKPFITSAFLSDTDIPFVLVPSDEEHAYDLYNAYGKRVLSFESEKTPILSIGKKSDGEDYEKVVLLSYTKGFVLYDANNLKELFSAKEEDAPDETYEITNVIEMDHILFREDYNVDSVTHYDELKKLYLIGDKLVKISDACSGRSASVAGKLVICDRDDDSKRYPIGEDGKMMKYPYNSYLKDESADYIDAKHYAVTNDDEDAVAIYDNGEVKKTYKDVYDVDTQANVDYKEYYYVIRTRNDKNDRKTIIVKADGTEVFAKDGYYTVSKINTNGQIILYDSGVYNSSDESGYSLYNADGSKVYGPVYSMKVINDKYYAYATGYIGSIYYYSNNKEKVKDIKAAIIDTTGKEVLSDSKYIDYEGNEGLVAAASIIKKSSTEKDDDDDDDDDYYSYRDYEYSYALFNKDLELIAEDIKEDETDFKHTKYFVLKKGGSYKYYNLDGKEIYSE